MHECSELQLVLPARKEVVRNAFAAELRRRAEHAIFTVLDARSEAPKLPYATWRRGCEVLGHTMQRQPVTLTPWSPTTPENANRRTRTDTGGPRRPEDDALLIGGDMPAPLQVMLAAAVAEARKQTRPLYEAEPRYAGYDEYDRLERVRSAWRAAWGSAPNGPARTRPTSGTAVSTSASWTPPPRQEDRCPRNWGNFNEADPRLADPQVLGAAGVRVEEELLLHGMRRSRLDDASGSDRVST